VVEGGGKDKDQNGTDWKLADSIGKKNVCAILSQGSIRRAAPKESLWPARSHGGPQKGQCRPVIRCHALTRRRVFTVYEIYFRLLPQTSLLRDTNGKIAACYGGAWLVKIGPSSKLHTRQRRQNHPRHCNPKADVHLAELKSAIDKLRRVSYCPMRRQRPECGSPLPLFPTLAGDTERPEGLPHSDLAEFRSATRLSKNSNHNPSSVVSHKCRPGSAPASRSRAAHR